MMKRIYGHDENGNRVSTRVLLERIYEELDKGEIDFEIFASGQHDLGGPFWNKHGKLLRFIIHNPGQRCGSMGMKDTYLEVHGSASADIGWLNSGATIVVKGDSGDTTGHCAAGGKIYIGGRAGARSGALMKHDPQNNPPYMWILKNTGSYPFEFMVGGVAVVCGVDCEGESVLGDRACAGMVGGVVYFRGDARGIAIDDVDVLNIDERDVEFLDSGLDDFLEKIGRLHLRAHLKNWVLWKKIVPKGYEEKHIREYCMTVAKFRKEKWVDGGIFSDVYFDDGNVVSLVNKDRYRLRVPEWENSKYMSPCQFQCPSLIPTQKRTQLLREGKLHEAVDLVLEYSPFPGSVCGMVCPNLCMNDCTRGNFDDSIDIKQFGIFSMGGEIPKIYKIKGKKVCVIGAGAGGLSAAWKLRREGYDVDVFEKEDKIGGKMFYAIPRERLPGVILNKELEMFEKVGIKITTKFNVTAKEFSELKMDYDAVIVAVGSHDSRVIPVPGHERILKGLDFLKSVNRKEPIKIGNKVVVIGAGNAGMDVAWEACEHGAKDVVCIDVQKPMAFDEEIKRVESRGVKIIWPAFIQEVTEYGVRLKDGAFIEADTVIISIGESPDLSFLKKESVTEKKMIACDDEFRVNGEENVFGVGDTVVPGLLTDAIGSGYQVALSVDAFLLGKKYEKLKKVQIDKEKIQTEYYRHYRKRVAMQKEFNPEIESKTCLSCGRCRDCGMCKEACPTGAIVRKNVGDGEFEYVSDKHHCIGCGLCVGVCPCGIWHLYPNKSEILDEVGSRKQIGE